jgi:hypothetical protein
VGALLGEPSEIVLDEVRQALPPDAEALRPIQIHGRQRRVDRDDVPALVEVV